MRRLRQRADDREEQRRMARPEGRVGIGHQLAAFCVPERPQLRPQRVDAGGQRVFVASAESATVTVVSITDPTSPSSDGTLDISTDLATSACTAYLDCYGGDDRKAVKVHSYADDDDFFDDDLYAALS